MGENSFGQLFCTFTLHFLMNKLVIFPKYNYKCISKCSIYTNTSSWLRASYLGRSHVGFCEILVSIFFFCKSQFNIYQYEEVMHFACNWSHWSDLQDKATEFWKSLEEYLCQRWQKRISVIVLSVFCLLWFHIYCVQTNLLPWLGNDVELMKLL